MSARLAATVDKEGRHCFVQVAPTCFSNLCFYLVPPSMRGATALNAATLSPGQIEALGAVAPVVKDRMQRRGKALIGFQTVHGYKNCWRMVIAGAKEALTEEGINGIIDSMLELSADL